MDELRGAAMAALEVVRGAPDTVVRAVSQRWVVAQHAGSVKKVARRASDRLLLRDGSGPWVTCDLSPENATALAQTLEIDDSDYLCTERAQRASVTRLGAPMPTSDAAALEMTAEILGAMLDIPAARVWLEQKEVIATGSGTLIEQHITTSWIEMHRFGGSLVSFMDGLSIPVPAPSSSEANVDSESNVILADPTATLSLAATVTRALRTSCVPPTLGRTELASTPVSIQRDPGIHSTLVAYDAEGVPCRYQPLIARGVAVGVLSDCQGARQHGLSRSSGSLFDNGEQLAVTADALTLERNEGGAASCEDMAASVGKGVLLRGPVQVVPTREGPRVRGRASSIEGGIISPAVGAIELPSIETLLRRVRNVGAKAEIVAILDAGRRPLVGHCPPLFIELATS